MIRIAFFMFLASAFVSCMDPASVQKYVGDKMEDADKHLYEQFVKDSSEFISLYKSAMAKDIGQVERQKFIAYYADLRSTIAHIDSLRAVVKQLPHNDNIDSVQAIFITGNTGKVLFKKINTNYDLAVALPMPANTKKEVVASKANFTDQDNNLDLLFAHATARSALWGLYGVEQELLQTGIAIFSDQ